MIVKEKMEDWTIYIWQPGKKIWEIKMKVEDGLFRVRIPITEEYTSKNIEEHILEDGQSILNMIKHIGVLAYIERDQDDKPFSYKELPDPRREIIYPIIYI